MTTKEKKINTKQLIGVVMRRKYEKRRKKYKK